MAQVAVTRYNLMRCWKCSVVSGQVVTLACGHHFCISCLEGQHSDSTEGCKQPCQACFKLTVPKKSDIRNLTSNMELPHIDGLNLEKGQLAVTSGGSDDKLRPCKISWKGTNANMSDRLREKAVLTAIEAVQRSDSYFERAKYVTEKFNADETGGWVCLAQSADTIGKADSYCTYYNNNYIWFRVGDRYFWLAQCSQ